LFCVAEGVKPPLRARLPLVWTGVKLDLNSAFRVGKAVYRGLALDHYCFALVRPVLEGGYCGLGREVNRRGPRTCRLPTKFTTEDRLIGENLLIGHVGVCGCLAVG
jgi:hypothetical protein